jgi:hypothetical protein
LKRVLFILFFALAVLKFCSCIGMKDLPEGGYEMMRVIKIDTTNEFHRFPIVIYWSSKKHEVITRTDEPHSFRVGQYAPFIIRK